MWRLLPNLMAAVFELSTLVAVVNAHVLQTHLISFRLQHLTSVDNNFSCNGASCQRKSIATYRKNLCKKCGVVQKLDNSPHRVLFSTFSLMSNSWQGDPLIRLALTLTWPLYLLINVNHVFGYENGCDYNTVLIAVGYNPLHSLVMLYFIAPTYHKSNASWILLRKKLLEDCSPVGRVSPSILRGVTVLLLRSKWGGNYVYFPFFYQVEGCRKGAWFRADICNQLRNEIEHT